MSDTLSQINRDKFVLLRVMLIGAVGGLIYYFVQKMIEAEFPPP